MNTKKRKEALVEIEKQAMLDKTAQEAIEAANNDPESDDDYGHKIFEHLLKNLKIKGFEDLD